MARITGRGCGCDSGESSFPAWNGERCLSCGRECFKTGDGLDLAIGPFKLEGGVLTVCAVLGIGEGRVASTSGNGLCLNGASLLTSKGLSIRYLCSSLMIIPGEWKSLVSSIKILLISPFPIIPTPSGLCPALLFALPPLCQCSQLPLS